MEVRGSPGPDESDDFRIQQDGGDLHGAGDREPSWMLHEYLTHRAPAIRQLATESDDSRFGTPAYSPPTVSAPGETLIVEVEAFHRL